MERLSLAVEPAQAASLPTRFTSEQLAHARHQASSTGERLLETLQSQSGLEPMAFIQCLGTTLHYPVLDTAQLFEATPVFDRVTLAQCLKREFILLRHDEAVIGVFADPFDTARLAWIDDCLHGAPLYLVQAPELAGFLARHEESFHAVDSLDTEGDAGIEHETLQSLSLASGGAVETRFLEMWTVYDSAADKTLLFMDRNRSTNTESHNSSRN